MSQAEKTSLLKRLESGVVLADGGMGSALYARGVFINRSFEDLNITNPKMVSSIHEAFVSAGSDVLESNTFGANRSKLKLFGLEDRLEGINRAGVELARQAVGDDGWVLGSMGPATGSGRGRAEEWSGDPAELREVFREQAAALAAAGADALILETFQSFEEMQAALEGARFGAPGLPSIAEMSWLFYEAAEKREPGSGARLIASLTGLGASAVGINCGSPEKIVRAVEAIRKATDAPVAAMPNAGEPELVDGRTLYLASPEYMAEYARRCADKGARLIGGCCGVTPEQIKEIASFLRSRFSRLGGRVQPTLSQPEKPDDGSLDAVPIGERSPFGANLGKKFMISVELDPPDGLDPKKSVEGAVFLAKNGIDAVNIADGPRAIPRMGPATLAQHVMRACDIQPIVHVCCRDRNILALQMDLIGFHSLGIRNLMLITGDPPKMGAYPDATAVFDLDSIRLIGFADKMNRGLDMGGRPLRDTTRFVLGTGCNPGAPNMEEEAERYAKKVEAGAEYVFCQPVYDIELVEKFFKLTGHVKPIPFFVGILPLASYKNAEFLTENVPGMEVPPEIRKRLKMAGTKELQREEGIKIAGESLREAKKFERVKGAYIFPPFGRYDAVLKTLEGA